VKLLLMNRWLAPLSLVVIFILGSCSSDYSSVVEDWKDDGWRVVEELGEVGDFTYQTDLESQTAAAVEASWIVNGDRKTKLYQQNSQLYLVLRFKKDNGDIFAVVMSKAR